jgi:hypothetical protein
MGQGWDPPQVGALALLAVMVIGNSAAVPLRSHSGRWHPLAYGIQGEVPEQR